MMRAVDALDAATVGTAEKPVRFGAPLRFETVVKRTGAQAFVCEA